MSDHSIQLVLMGINSVTLVVLLWYSFETLRLRKAAQDQLEALAKPCLTLWAELREPTDAILAMDQVVGNTIARSDDGTFVVQNIGNGVALNVRYLFKPLDAVAPQARDRPSYLQTVLQGQKVATPELVNAYSGNYELIFRFDSIGGKSYQSTVTLQNRVLTAFRFQRVHSAASMQ